MRIDLYTKAVLTVIALLLAAVAIRPMFQPQPTFAQSGTSYAYLVPQAGDANMNGGKHFIDMRNGNLWMCDFKDCKVEGKFPFEKTH